MLQMEKLQKVYRTEMVETYALRDFNLTVNEGEFVAVTGPSGSGKTTFLTIAGLLEAFSGGSYKLDGIDVSRMGDGERSRIRNQKIGFIFQAFNLIPDLNVLDNIEVPLRYRGYGSAERKKRAADALSRVACRPAAATTRPSCPAASSSAWPSRARWPASRACCWRTSPPATSTARWRAASWSCWRSCTATAPPSSWSRTTRSSRRVRSAMSTSSTARSSTSPRNSPHK